MNCVDWVAVNLYQTSSFAFPVHAASDWVAYVPSPPTELQVAPTLTFLAFSQRSFSTTLTTQVVKAIFAGLVEDASKIR